MASLRDILSEQLAERLGREAGESASASSGVHAVAPAPSSRIATTSWAAAASAARPAAVVAEASAVGELPASDIDADLALALALQEQEDAAAATSGHNGNAPRRRCIDDVVSFSTRRGPQPQRQSKPGNAAGKVVVVDADERLLEQVKRESLAMAAGGAGGRRLLSADDAGHDDDGAPAGARLGTGVATFPPPANGSGADSAEPAMAAPHQASSHGTGASGAWGRSANNNTSNNHHHQQHRGATHARATALATAGNISKHEARMQLRDERDELLYQQLKGRTHVQVGGTGGAGANANIRRSTAAAVARQGYDEHGFAGDDFGLFDEDDGNENNNNANRGGAAGGRGGHGQAAAGAGGAGGRMITKHDAGLCGRRNARALERRLGSGSGDLSSTSVRLTQSAVSTLQVCIVCTTGSLFGVPNRPQNVCGYAVLL